MAALWLLLASSSTGATVDATPSPDYRSPRLAASFSRESASFSHFAIDVLGKGRVDDDTVLPVPPEEEARWKVEDRGAGGKGERAFAVRFTVGRATGEWRVVCSP